MTPRHPSTGRTRVRLYTAIVLFIGLVVVLAPQATGIALHEWASFLVIGPLLVHLVIDWEWIVSASSRFFGTQPGRIRFNYCWDWLLFAMMTVATVSGVAISEAALPALGITITIDPFWSVAHDISANLLMVMLGVHLGMHWKWIMSAVQPELGPTAESELASEG